MWIPPKGDPGRSRLLCNVQDIVGFAGRFIHCMCAGRIHLAKAESFQSPRHGTLLLKRTSGAISWKLQLFARSLLLRGGTNALKDHMSETEQARSQLSLSSLFSKPRQVRKVQRRLGRLQSAPEGATPVRRDAARMMVLIRIVPNQQQLWVCLRRELIKSRVLPHRMMLQLWQSLHWMHTETSLKFRPAEDATA